MFEGNGALVLGDVDFLVEPSLSSSRFVNMSLALPLLLLLQLPQLAPALLCDEPSSLFLCHLASLPSLGQGERPTNAAAAKLPVEVNEERNYF